jgi:biotin--protein ligase
MIVSFWAGFFVSRALWTKLQDVLEFVVIYQSMTKFWSCYPLVVHPGLNPSVIQSILNRQFNSTRIILRRKGCVVAVTEPYSPSLKSGEPIFLDAVSIKDNSVFKKYSGSISYLNFCRLVKRYISTKGCLENTRNPAILTTKSNSNCNSPQKATSLETNNPKHTKPDRPAVNIFIVTESAPLEQVVLSLVDRSRFVVYSLTPTQALTQAWTTGAALLIFASDTLEKRLSDKIQIYLTNGGSIVSLSGIVSSSSFDKRFSTQITYSGFHFESVDSHRDLFSHLLKKLGFIPPETADIVPSRTQGHCTDLKLLPSDLTNQGFSLVTEPDCESTQYVLSLVESNPLPSGFEEEKFRRYLASSIDMRVMYIPVVDSTWPITTLLAEKQCHRFLVTADMQLNGVGRGENKWISNLGCCMFSFSMELASLPDGLAPSALPHLVALAICRSVTSRHPKVPIRIKWPNDLYCGEDVKIGGILVACSVSGTAWTFKIGVGVNLDNDQPTTCINKMIRDLDPSLAPISREELTAEIVTKFTQLLTSETGFDQSTRDEYCSHWIHTDQHVKYSDGSHVSDGTVKSVDEEGFLLVETSDKRLLSLHPDYNRFDMMQNLIYPFKK